MCVLCVCVCVCVCVTYLPQVDGKVDFIVFDPA
jgi:hypothetical protein